MYNTKDIQFVGKHDYAKSNLGTTGWNSTFSVGIFKWELKSNGKEMKKGKAIVRVSGCTGRQKEVYSMAELVVKLLDSGEWDGRKTVSIK